MSGTPAIAGPSSDPDPEGKYDETRGPHRLIIILRGAGFHDVLTIEPGLFEARKGGEKYIVHESGEVYAGGRVASGLQSFLDEYYVPNKDTNENGDEKGD